MLKKVAKSVDLAVRSLQQRTFFRRVASLTLKNSSPDGGCLLPYPPEFKRARSRSSCWYDCWHPRCCITPERELEAAMESINSTTIPTVHKEPTARKRLLGCSPLPPSPSHSFLPALATKSSAVKLEKFRRSPSVQLPQLPDKDQSLQRSISRIYRRTASTTNAPERQKPHAPQKHCRNSAPAPYSSNLAEPGTEPQKPDLTTPEREIVLFVLPNLIPVLRNQT